MGHQYHDKFDSPAAMARWIADNDIGWLVLDKQAVLGQARLGRDLAQVITDGALKAKPVMSTANRRMSGGELTLYALAAVDRPPRDPAPILAQLAPSGAP